jgi:prevent-host-death family protein
MKDVNVTELRQRLPSYLNRVRRGERIKITSRGKVIAELLPPSVTTTEAASARDRLRGTLVRYEDVLEPVISPSEWDVNR